nr:MAG TPA: hypothetical protein [Caudoviricetes sp.]
MKLSMQDTALVGFVSHNITCKDKRLYAFKKLSIAHIESLYRYRGNQQEAMH